MSLKNTKSTSCYRTIPKRCRDCAKAIYVAELDKEILYQCSMYGVFKRECSAGCLRKKPLPHPKEINKE